MTSEDALSTVGVGESSSDNNVSWPLSPAWLMKCWRLLIALLLLICTGILTGGPLEAVLEDDDEAEDGDVALDAVDESDWVKLPRRSSFSRVRSPSILANFGRRSTRKKVENPIQIMHYGFINFLLNRSFGWWCINVDVLGWQTHL